MRNQFPYDNNAYYHLTSDNSFHGTYNLKEALNGFCNCCKGLHVCIICTDTLPETSIDESWINNVIVIALREGVLIDENVIDALINRNLINEVFTLFKSLGYRIVSEDETGNWQRGKYVSVGTGKCYCDVLSKIKDVFRQLDKEIENTQTTIIEICRLNETIGMLKKFCDMDTAASLTTGFITEKELENGCADIKVIFFLPQEFYDIFSSPKCLFPDFIEYVILALSPIGIVELVQDYEKKLKSKNKEIERLTKEKGIQEDFIVSLFKSSDPNKWIDVTQKLKADGRLTIELYSQLLRMMNPEKDESLNKGPNYIKDNDVSKQEVKTENADTEIKSNNENDIITPSKDNDGR